jgi:hypothetical protein
MARLCIPKHAATNINAIIPRRRWVDNIKIDLTEIGWGGVDLIGLVQDWDQWRAVVNMVINLQVP